MAREGSVAPKERVYIIYETAEGEFPSSQEVELPLKILMMGDYTTREDWTPLDERRPINVRDDNFNEVLREHELKLDLNVPDKLSQEQGAEILVKLRFEKMKDFSPEGVACQVPELRKLIELRSALDALRGPLGGVTAFRSKLQAILDDEALKAQLLRELAAPAPPLRPPPPPGSLEDLRLRARPWCEVISVEAPGGTDPTDDARFDDIPRLVTPRTVDEYLREATGLDLAALEARIMHPRRRQLDAVRDAVAGVVDPGEALELLAARELIPMSWPVGTERGFARGSCATCGRVQEHTSRCPHKDRSLAELIVRAPPHLASVVTLASDPEGVSTAEALAREAVARWEPWSGMRPKRVCWAIGSILGKETDHPGPRGPWMAARRAAEIAGSYAPVAAFDKRVTGRAQQFSDAFYGSQEWSYAASRRLAVQPGPKTPEPLVGRRFAELPDPFAPALAIWALGYRIALVEPACVVLFAPEVQ